MEKIASEMEDEWEETWAKERLAAIDNYKNASTMQEDGECLLRYGTLLGQVQKEKLLALHEEVRALKHSVVSVPTAKEKKQILQVSS